jgi:hypothetical protein
MAKRQQNTALWIGGAIVVAAVVGGVFYLAKKPAALAALPPPTPGPGSPPAPTPAPAAPFPTTPSPAPPASPPAASPPSTRNLSLVAGVNNFQIVNGDSLAIQAPTSTQFLSDLTLDGVTGAVSALGRSAVIFPLGALGLGQHTISGVFTSLQSFTVNLTVIA